MKRDQIIAAIEEMRTQSVSNSGRAEFTKIMHREAQRRSRIADDFHRAIVYCFILFTRVGYLNKERRNFLRPTKRSLLMSAALFVVAILQLFVIAILLDLVGLEDYAIVIILFVLLFELGYIVTKGNEMIRGHMGNEFGMSQRCIECRYDLSSLDSVLGDTLWVGPEVCPECGCVYPAVV